MDDIKHLLFNAISDFRLSQTTSKSQLTTYITLIALGIHEASTAYCASRRSTSLIQVIRLLTEFHCALDLVSVFLDEIRYTREESSTMGRWTIVWNAGRRICYGYN